MKQQNINFMSLIINFEGKEPEEIIKQWTKFTNEVFYLCNYHSDYSVSEMIGVLKFMRPIMIVDDNMNAASKEFQPSLKVRYGELLTELYKIKESKKIIKITVDSN